MGSWTVGVMTANSPSERCPSQLEGPLELNDGRTNWRALGIIPHLVRSRAVGMLRDPHRVADRLHPGPVLRRREVARHLREIIRPFVDPSASVVERLMVSIPEIFQVTSQMIEEVRLD